MLAVVKLNATAYNAGEIKIFFSKVRAAMSCINKSWQIKLVIAAALVMAAALGCQREQIQKYSVTNLDSSSSRITPVSTQSAVKPGEVARLVAAIAERPDAAWVFKILGTKANVDATESVWRPFLEQVTFDAGNQPQWKLPEGWTQAPGNEFRFATLTIGSVQPPVDVAISRLPAGQDVFANVNRWRGQLGLKPVPPTEVESGLKKITAGDATMLLFDESGELSGALPGMGAPAAPMAANSTVPKVDSAPAEPSTLPFEFTAPADWERGPTTQFTQHRFLKKDGERSVQLAVTRLPAGAQAWTDNVNMWRGELELSSLSSAEIEQQTKEVMLDGRTAKSIFLKSGDDKGKSSQIVSLTTDTDSWFFKLTGDATLVAESQASFDQFIQSIRFKLP